MEEACREALLQGLSPATAVATLVLLDRLHISEDEKGLIIELIKKNAKDVVKGKDWKLFIANYPDLVTDIVTALALGL
jgi:hypothetical protein